MWGLWAVPLLLFCILLFVGGVVAALVWHFGRAKGRRGSLLKVLAIPVGCAALPVALIGLLLAYFAAMKKSDTELFEEVFGYTTTITEDRLLFDDFDLDTGRMVFMRAQPTDAERVQLLDLPGLRESTQSLEYFSNMGGSRGIGGWWISTQGMGNHCAAARIRQAADVNGWSAIHIAECTDVGSDWQSPGTLDEVYVIAERGGE